jgi:hypothetical protein
MSQFDSRESQLRCKCGYTGTITSHESDSQWGSLNTDYRIIGFGKDLTTNIEKRSTFDDALAQLKPKCPECGALVTSTGLAKSRK